MRHWRGLSLLFLLTALIVALFCMLTALVANRPGAPMFPDTAVLWNEGWRSDNGTTPVLPCEIRPSQTKGRAILEKRLPETLPEDAVLVLRSNYLPVEAEVGGETLWVSGSFIQSGPFRLTYAGPASLVRLNAACAGQTLRLTFHPGGSKTRMELHEVVLGSAEGVLTHYMLKDEFITSFGWLLFALAMGMFLFSLILNKFNAREFFLGFFYTSLSLLLTSVWVLSDIGACAVRYGHHSIYLFINLFSYLLVPVPILLLLRNYITRGGRALDALAVLTLLLNVAVVMLCCLGIFDLSVTLTASHVLYVLVIWACFITLLRALREKGNPAARPLFVGMLLSAVTGGITLASFYLRQTPDNTASFKYGICAYALVMTYVAGRRAIHLMVESQSTRRLQYAASHDALTGIPNRQAFCDAVQTRLADHPDEPLAIGTLDIAQFKLVNDMFGREQGDHILKYLADALKTVMAGRGTAARLESDRFALCMAGDLSQIQEVIAVVEERISHFPIAFSLLLSFGWYITGGETLSPEAMLDRSALARQTVKGSFVNNSAFYDEQLRSEILRERAIVNQSGEALKKGQFLLVYQPKYNLESGKCCGAEALVRWRHPQHGMIPPSQFIPLFERNGLITKLDEYVWARACEMIGRLIQRYGPDQTPPISVNVSRVDLFNPNLVALISDIADRACVPRRLLALEITESAYAEAPTLMEKRVRDLRAAGFSVHMDDFGSAYSSLNMLKEIEVDLLKLDMRFLSGSDHEDRTRGILMAIFQMARILKLSVVAEGVETKEQADMLRTLGCDAAQGYYFSKPIDEEAYMSILVAQTPAADAIPGILGTITP